MKLPNFCLSKRITIIALALVVVGALAMIFVENSRLRDVYLSDRHANLEQRLHDEKLRLNQAINTLRQDVLFLSNTPPVSGIVRAELNNGYDPRYGNTSKAWGEHLQQIFSAFSSARTDYFQIRYIGVADGGRELVRVDNREGKIEITPSVRLQAKADRDYFKATLGLHAGEVHLSEFNLNREMGVIEQPYRPTLRVSTPIFTPAGKIFGMVVINMDASHLLARATSGLPEGVQACITNMGGEYLLHPDPTRSFGFELGGKDNIITDFSGVKTLFDTQTPELLFLQAAAAKTGNQYVAAGRIHFDSGDPARFMVLTYQIPDAVAAQQIARIPARNIVGGFLAVLLVSVIAMLVLRRIFAPLERITSAAEKITTGDHDLLLPQDGSGEIGSLTNALNTMLAKLAQREQDINHVNDRLTALIEAIPDAIIFKDSVGRWLITNEPAKQLFQLHGIPWQGKTGIELSDLRPAFRVAQGVFLADDEKTWKAGQLTLFEENITTGDGALRNYDVRKIPLFGDEGQRRGLVIIGRDITGQKRAEESLRKSAEEIEDIYNHAPCGYHSLDKDGNILRINDTELAWLGYTRDEVAGKMKWPDLLTPAGLQIFRESFPQLLKQGFVRDIEAGIIRKDGTVLEGFINATAIYDTGGNFVMSRSTVIDITRRKQAEEKLRESDIWLRHIVGSMPGTVFEMVDANNGKGVSFSYISESVVMLFGVTANELMSKPELLFDCLYAEDAPGFENSRLSSARTLTTWDWEGRIRTATQPRKWINLRATPHRRDDGVLVWGGVILNITNHMCTEIELVKSRQLLRELAAQSEAALEEERKRIAREVHDELGQILTALRMDVGLLRLQFGGHDAALEKVQGMTVLLDRAIQCARDVVSNLRPTALDMGIVAAIEWLCNEFAQHTGTACYLRSAEEYIDLNEVRAMAAFRIVQESLTNVARHAEASSVEISLEQRSGVLHVNVRDNGKGFDPASMASRKSFGLLGMRERAITLGGNVDVASVPQQGTTVTFDMPIQPNGDIQ